MKYTTSFKRHLTAVTALMSLTCLVHAGSGNLQRTYQQISGVLNTMEQQANAENLSNTYSGKLFNNIDSMKNDLNSATSLSRGAQSSGGSGLSILIELAADAADTGAIHNFSADAKQNIAAELDNSIDSLTDQEKIEDVNDVLNVLMGGETSMIATPAAHLSTGHTGVESSIAPRRNRNFQFRKQPRVQAQPSSGGGLLVASSMPAIGHSSAPASLQERLAKVQQGRHTDSSRPVSGAMVAPQSKPKSSFFNPFNSNFGSTKKVAPQPISAATPRTSSPPVTAIPLTSNSLRVAGSKNLIDTTAAAVVPTSTMTTTSLRRSASRSLSGRSTAAGTSASVPADASGDPQPVVVDTVVPTVSASVTPAVAESKKKKFQAGLVPLQVPALDANLDAKLKFEREKIGDFSEGETVAAPVALDAAGETSVSPATVDMKAGNRGKANLRNAVRTGFLAHKLPTSASAGSGATSGAGAGGADAPKS